MTIFAVVMSSLALLAATGSVMITVMERKRSQERNTAQLQYTDTSVKAVEERLDARVGNLEKGIVPDFEKAKEAANAVNNFNAGITGILGYDPYTALQAQRDKESRGEQR